jgi:hypothetical protein
MDRQKTDRQIGKLANWQAWGGWIECWDVFSKSFPGLSTSKALTLPAWMSVLGGKTAAHTWLVRSHAFPYVNRHLRIDPCISCAPQIISPVDPRIHFTLNCGAALASLPACSLASVNTDSSASVRLFVCLCGECVCSRGE